MLYIFNTVPRVTVTDTSSKATTGALAQAQRYLCLNPFDNFQYILLDFFGHMTNLLLIFMTNNLPCNPFANTSIILIF